MFVDTWMAGGLGRAQGGYDEMVFRSMVRDGTPFYDPLGLVSEGTQNRLPGRGQLVSVRHAVHDLARAPLFAREADRVGVAPRRQPRATTPRSSVTCSARRSRRRGAQWVKDEHAASSSSNLDAIRAYPVTPLPRRDRRTRWGRCRAPTTIRPTAGSTRAFNYPGVLSHVGAIGTGRRRRDRIDKLADIKGPSIYTVTALAYDPAAHTIFYTADNNAYRDLMSVDTVTHRTRMLHEGRAHRRPGVQPGRPIALGHPPPERHLHAGSDCRAVHATGSASSRGRTARSSTTSTSRRTDRALAASFGEISGKQEVRVFQTAAPLSAAIRRRSRGSISAPPCRTGSSSRRMAATCTEARTTRARRTSSATTSRRRSSTRSPTPKPGSSGRFRSAATR